MVDNLINTLTSLPGFEIILLFLVGSVAGFINVMAGGGSLLTLPVLIFLGLPSNVANATNRIGIFLQNIFAIQGFRSKGVFVFPYSLYLGISALIGALIGSFIAVDLPDEVFNKILALVMLMVIVFMLLPGLKNENKVERLGGKHQIIAIFVFFLIGIYGGFIQAGTGYLIMISLSLINRISLIKVNFIKVFVALTYTIGALGIFIFNGLVNWKLGIALACGNALGGWVSSRFQVENGEKWIRFFLFIALIGMAIKLWFF